MNLRCQYCGERIVARGFGKCPGCYRDLPEELQLSAAEKEIEEIDQKNEKANYPGERGGLGPSPASLSEAAREIRPSNGQT